jgi:hypothetical protein
MSTEYNHSRLDNAIVISFPISILIIICSMVVIEGSPPLVHKAFYLSFQLFFRVIPIFATLRILFSKNRPLGAWTWTESILSGIWLAFGLSAQISYTAGHWAPLLMLCIITGLAVALSPLLVRGSSEFNETN